MRLSTRALAVAAVTGALVAASLTSCTASPDSAGQAPDLFHSLPGTGTSPPSPTSPSGKPREDADAVAANWKLVSSDNFNASEINEDKWGLYDSVGGFGNGTRSSKAISQSGGQLHITARNVDGGISGGMQDGSRQTYGRYEVRARTDYGRGFGSAILLWPVSENQSEGELDIVEVPFERRDKANFISHAGPNGQLTVGGDLDGDFSQWHTFAMEWLPDSVTWYVDGAKIYTLTDKAFIPRTPMNLAIQLDQGPVKNWMLAPDATTPPEVNLDVDWVRIYAPRNKPA